MNDFYIEGLKTIGIILIGVAGFFLVVGMTILLFSYIPRGDILSPPKLKELEIRLKYACTQAERNTLLNPQGNKNETR